MTVPASALILGWYLAGSAVLFALYGADKSAAKRGGPRIPEKVLHAIALLGGWPGGLLGQQVFRHKTRKQPFGIVFWGTVILNCAAIAWLVTAVPMNP